MRVMQGADTLGKDLGMRTFSAYVEWDPESKLYVGIIPGIPGAHIQAASLNELRSNLTEVFDLCLEEAC